MAGHVDNATRGPTRAHARGFTGPASGVAGGDDSPVVPRRRLAATRPRRGVNRNPTSGRRAFEGETISDVLAKVIEREPDWTALPASTPPRLRELLRRCGKKDLRAAVPDHAGRRRVPCRSRFYPDSQEEIDGTRSNHLRATFERGRCQRVEAMTGAAWNARALVSRRTPVAASRLDRRAIGVRRWFTLVSGRQPQART